jgi:ubiquinol-cytochrome c reductase cytochrome b subunit
VAVFFAAPLESIANPLSTPLHTVAPWYFYWLQGLLKIADKTVAGVIVPGVLLVLLMAIPYLDRNPSRRGRDRRVAIISGVVAGFVIIVLSWMGTPYYAVKASPAVEIVQELMPEEGMGPIREMGYAHLPIGAYDTRTNPTSGDPELDKVLGEFTTAIKEFGEKDPSFNEPYGVLTISQEQPQLKRITWDVFWLSPDGKEETFKRIFFLHENAKYWEQYGLRDFSYLRKEQPAEGK